MRWPTREVSKLGVVMLGATLSACSVLPQESPDDAVRRALDRVVAHDVVAASAEVCVDRRDPADFPFPISGIFAPVQALPGFDIPRALAVIDLDVSQLELAETARDGDAAEVRVSGILVQRFDPTQVEALFRAYAAESGQPLEQPLLDETLAPVSRGDVALPVDESIRVIREGGSWKVCPIAPQS